MGFRRAERGASAVEFAIIASVLFMVLFGTIQFGIAYNRYQGLQAAAREGARLGSLPTTTKLEIRNRVKDSLSIIAPANVADTCPGTLAVEKGCIDIQLRSPAGSGTLGAAGNQPCDGKPDDAVYVEVRYKMSIPIPFWGNPAITITASGEFVCE